MALVFIGLFSLFWDVFFLTQAIIEIGSSVGFKMTKIQRLIKSSFSVVAIISVVSTIYICIQVARMKKMGKSGPVHVIFLDVCLGVWGMTSIRFYNAQKLEQIRPKLVNSLKDKGYDVMNKEIQTRARDYVNVTADFQKPEKKKYLAEVESEYLTKEQREKFKEDPRLRVTGKYVRKAYPDTYKNKAKNPEYWMRIVADTINSLNHAGYKQYEDLYKQESAIIEQYNELRKKIKDNNSEFPTLDQMIALENSCEKLKNTIGNVRNDMKGYRVENKISAKGELYSISTANKYVDKAYTVFDELTTSVDDLEGNVKEMIRHSYGEGNKSVDEILALVGNSNADIDELEKARKQMLEAQGSILKDEIGNNASQDVVTEINTLMSDLNNYVDRAKYHHDISMFKDEYLGFTYNIVKSDKDIQNNQKEDRLYEDSATGQSISEQSISGQSISDGGIEDQGLNESGKVVDVTPKMWTNNRKIHMSRLSTLIFDYSNSDDGSYRQELEELGEENYKQQKIFLDTSESDKALGLLFGNKKYFPHKGKAVLAALFSIFLDIGAAAVGVMIYFVKRKNKEEENRV